MTTDVDSGLADLAELVQRSTVQVHADNRGGGSGVIWNGDGAIVTNAHVVGSAQEVSIEFTGGLTSRGLVALRDERLDLAEVRLSSAPAGMSGAMIGRAGALRVGDFVAALGAPLGIAGALSVGIVHRALVDPSGAHGRWLEADLRLAPGNSGGPMVDARGHVVGINSMIAGGLALAVPSEAADRFVRTRGARAWLGVTTQPVPLMNPADRPQTRSNEPTLGFMIVDVAPGSPAQLAGLVLGDVIVRIAADCFNRLESLGNALDRIAPNEEITVEILRGRSLRSVVIVTGTLTARVDRAA